MVHIDTGCRFLLGSDWRMGVTAGCETCLLDQVQEELVPVVFRRVSRHDKLVGVQPGWDIVGLAAVARAGVLGNETARCGAHCMERRSVAMKAAHVCRRNAAARERWLT